MLSLFPELLFLAPFSALVLRIALAATLAYSAWRHEMSRETLVRLLGAVELGIAASLALGWGAQAGAVLAAATVAASLAIPRVRALPPSTLWLLLALSLSILVTGAGAFAFDLPL
jgi:hypothetical protein